MQAFELYFNPKKKDDVFFHSFVYEPANIYEKRLGNLYIIGELAQALPQNAHFLTNLCSAVKKEYYSSGLKKSCQASLQEALKKANEFLDQESKKGNISWLGNLNFAILNLKTPDLNFAKTGEIKTFLARNNELTDIGQGLDGDLAHPDPLKIFDSMVEGKLAPDDKIIVLNKNILSAFGKKQNFLAALAKVSDEKGIKQVLKIHEANLAGVCGLGLVLMPGDKDNAHETLTFQKDLPLFSFSDNLIKPATRFFAKIRLPSFKIKTPAFPRFPKPHITFNRKKIILIIALISVLAAFYYLFSGERERELKEAEQVLSEAKTKAMLAESLLILDKNEQARALFEEALRIIAPLTKRGAPLREEALPLQEKIKEALK